MTDPRFDAMEKLLGRIRWDPIPASLRVVNWDADWLRVCYETGETEPSTEWVWDDPVLRDWCYR